MNKDYPEQIFWSSLIFNQIEAAKDKIVQYETMWGEIRLWKWNSTQWGASFIDGVYSIEYSWDEALEAAALKAINVHKQEISELEGHIEHVILYGSD